MSKDTPINVLSLFDGMSCGQQALERANIPVNTYFASEVDKYAIKVTMANYPNTKQLGDVRNVDPNDLPIINLLIGGSPCQSFSFAGKRKGMSTKDNIEILTIEKYFELREQNFEFEGQSYLFWEYIRVLTELRKKNPNIKFLLENVMMGEKWQKILTQAIGINPIEINSDLVSAQNRRRLYWTNMAAEPDGFFGDLVCKIQQPKDKGILLKDILETEVAEKYFLSNKAVETIAKYSNDNYEVTGKTPTITCELAYGYGKNISPNISKEIFFAGLNPDKKSRTVRSGGKDSLEDKHNWNLIVHNTMPRSSKTKKGGAGPLSRNDGKTYCLDTGNTNAIEVVKIDKKGNIKNNQNKSSCFTAGGNSGGNHSDMDLLFCKNYIQWDTSGKGYGSQQDRAFYEDGKHGTLSAMRGEEKCNVLLNTNRIRRLIPIECERLQTVKDNYTACVSDTQRYRMLGNGWTVDVIAHIFSYLNFNP